MLHKKTKRFAAGLMVATQLLSLSAFADLGEVLDEYSMNLREDTDLSHSIYWTGSDYRRENYIEYSPNDEVFPVVVYGSKLLNYGSFSSMAKLLNEEGYYVIGGINGDYYNTWNYEPLGVVISAGELISTDGGHYGIGFAEDGTAVIGQPSIVMKMSFYGETFTLNALNKSRAQDHTLYSSEFASTTQGSGNSLDIVLSIDDDAIITTDCELSFTVEEVIDAEGATTIPEGKYILSLPTTADEWRLSNTAKLQVGDTITMTVTADEEWSDISYAAGGLYSLVEDGVVNPDLQNVSDPRTAIGVREDGSTVFYTIDGRLSGYSVGATMTQVAERMLELGCVDAMLLDGGGSTTLNAVQAGESALSQINAPSSGTARSVTNYIMLVSKTEPTGEADRLVVYPQSSHMLVGAELELEVLATDEVGFATDAPTALIYSVDSELGSFDKSIFIAEAEGEGEIKVFSGELTEGVAKVNIVANPDTVTVYNEETGKTVSKISLETGESLDLTATASDNHLDLIVSDTCFTWSVSDELGEFDEMGVFTAGEEYGEGEITVQVGENITTIALEIAYPAGIYEDVAEDSWYYDAVLNMGKRGLVSGVSDTEFAPDSSMTRAMFVTVLHRMAGSPTPETENSFADIESGKWYSDAVSWASENGLVTGYDETTFGINDSISREQMATLLMRYAVYNGEEIESSDAINTLTDSDLVQDYAKDAVSWAVSAGLITGMGDGSFAPQDTATRAQTAVLLSRYVD